MRLVLLHLMVLTVFVEGVSVGGVTWGRLVGVLVIGALVVVVAGRPRTGVLPHPWVLVPTVLLSAWLLLTGIWAVSGAGWRTVVFEFALALVFFLGYVVLIDSRETIRRLLVAYAVAATVVAPIAVWQFLLGLRAVGLQGDPNTFALYQLAALPIALQLWVRRGPGGRAWWAFSTGLLLASVLASQSRGAALALVVVTLWLLGTGLHGLIPRRTRPLAVAGGIGAIGIAAALAVAYLPRFDPAQTAQDGGTGRLFIWQAAWRSWWENPQGLGAGGFLADSGRLLSRTPGIDLDPYSVLFEGIKIHNSYLEALVDLGPVGLLLCGALVVGIGLLLAEERRRHPEALTASLVPMLLVFLTAAIFLSVLNNKLLWMLAGFAAVLPYLPARAGAPARGEAPELQLSKGTP